MTSAQSRSGGKRQCPAGRPSATRWGSSPGASSPRNKPYLLSSVALRYCPCRPQREHFSRTISPGYSASENEPRRLRTKVSSSSEIAWRTKVQLWHSLEQYRSLSWLVRAQYVRLIYSRAPMEQHQHIMMHLGG